MSVLGFGDLEFWAFFREGIVQPRRPKNNTPCRVAVDGLIDGYDSEGDGDGPSGSVGKDVEKSEENCGSRKVR